MQRLIAAADAQSITALVLAWQTGGISHDTLFDALRKGEVIPDGRSNAEEKALAGKGFRFLKGGAKLLAGLSVSEDSRFHLQR